MADEIASPALDAGSVERAGAVTAFFDDRATAQKAVDDLVAAGIARERIAWVEGGAVPVEGEPKPTAKKSLWDNVRDLFMAEDDRHAYGEGLRRGGILLSVETDASDHDHVVQILDREGAVDMDGRQRDWELQGWNPVRAEQDASDSAAIADLQAGAADRTAAVRATSPSRVRSYRSADDGTARET